jgi:glucose-1-phosphate adenylyltransferase
MVDNLNRVTAVILGGGRGSRLLPLTLYRAKPAVGFAGKHRIIDIPISNCINSGIKRIFVLTQFLSTSLHRHIMQTYRFDQFTDGFLEIVAADQTLLREDWFQGPADAVRATLDHTMYYKSDLMLILSGDQLYRMNYADFIRSHNERNADITICAHPVNRTEAARMGLIEVDEDCCVRRFVEKPQAADVIDAFRVPEHLASRLKPNSADDVIASTGMYVFKPGVLRDVLSGSTAADFGAGIFQEAIKTLRVCAYLFPDYWRDIGTIRAFFDANISLGMRRSPFRLYAPAWPIYTRARSLPPSHITASEITNTLVGEGAFIAGARIVESVIGMRNVVRRGSDLKHVVMLGTDFYEGEELIAGQEGQAGEAPGLGIGRGCRIERAIIDKNARIGDNVVIRARPDMADLKSDNYWIRDGITVVPKGAVIPSGTEI